MPPKKNNKKGDENDDSGLEKIAQLQLKVKALEMKFVEEQEAASIEKAKENESLIRVMDLENDFKKEQERLFAITSDMTRQFKQMQDQKQNELNALNQLIIEKQSIIEQKSQYIDQLQDDQNTKLKKKDDDIAELRRKIEDMSNEFAIMLKETLQKMEERVNYAPWDNDTDPYMIKKLKEIAIKDQ